MKVYSIKVNGKLMES